MREFDYIKTNFEELTEEIEKIAGICGTPAPKLVSVTKSGSDAELLALFGFGAKACGENRPQELKRRGDLLREAGLFPELHEIGNLQSNKVKMIAEKVTLIHSLDSFSLAKEINRQAQKFGRVIPVLIEVNSAKEEQKGGINPELVIPFFESLKELTSIEVKGLMTMGPAECEERELRSYFRLTKKLFDRIDTEYGFGEGATLSMGMSDSYGLAIEEGSTLVRVGRKLFRKN